MELAGIIYLADTAWQILHRLNREEAGRYLEDRASQGFTVVHAVVLGLDAPNANGDRATATVPSSSRAAAATGCW